MKFKVSSTRVPPYGFTMHLVTSVRAAKKLSEAFGGIDSFDGSTLGTTATAVSQDNGSIHLIFFVKKKGSEPAQLVDTCAHEAAHGAAAMAQHFGIDTSDPGAEHYAYLLGYIAGWLWRETVEPQDQETWTA